MTNLCLKYGLVSDIKAGFAKVSFEEDGIVSDWLPVVVRKTKSDKESWQLEINEHVVCLMMHDCDEGVVIGAIPNDQDTPDPGEAGGKYRKLFSDGTLIEYDKDAGKLTVDVKGDLLAETQGAATIQAGGAIKAASDTSADIEAPKVTCKASATATVEAPVIALKGNVSVAGTLAVAGAMTAATIATTGGGTITSEGNMTVQGSVTAIGEIQGSAIKAGVIDLAAHKHSGVTTGPGASGPAIP